MSSSLFTLSLLSSLLSLLLVDPVLAQYKVTNAGTATVSGLVTLKGAPARDVTVLLQAPGLGSSNSPRARTDENGRFHFAGVAAGRYSISALAPGHILPGDDGMGMWSRGQSIDVARGGKVVVSDTGQPAPGVHIYGSGLSHEGKPSGWGRIVERSKSNGEFSLIGLPPGRYTLLPALI